MIEYQASSCNLFANQFFIQKIPLDTLLANSLFNYCTVGNAHFLFSLDTLIVFIKNVPSCANLAFFGYSINFHTISLNRSTSKIFCSIITIITYFAAIFISTFPLSFTIVDFLVLEALNSSSERVQIIALLTYSTLSIIGVMLLTVGISHLALTPNNPVALSTLLTDHIPGNIKTVRDLNDGGTSNKGNEKKNNDIHEQQYKQRLLFWINMKQNSCQFVWGCNIWQYADRMDQKQTGILRSAC